MLYNKYRPKKLSQLVGNEATKKDLQKRLETDSVPSVTMLVGESGTGKSTVASILAAAINCHNPIKSENGYEPCGECDACKDVFDGDYKRDVVFFDGSDLGKDSIEQIRDQVSYDPYFDSRNIVVIDEAQNITTGGLERTLKLLETERDNTHFILCTMNPKAFNKAIRSRGQVYQFDKLPVNVIGDYLVDVLDGEDPDEELPESLVTEGVVTIAEHSSGSLREAISLLERAINSDLYDRKAIERELNLVSESKTFNLLVMLLRQEPTFFEEIQQTDLKAFFYYSWKVINETAMRSFTLESLDPDDWKVKNSKKLLRYDSFWQLFDMFLELQKTQHNYFNENAFLTKLIQFFRIHKEQNPPKLTEKKDESESRRGRRAKRAS